MSAVTTTFIINDYYAPPGHKKKDPKETWVTFAGAFTNTGTPQTAGSNHLHLARTWQSVRLTDMMALVSQPYFKGVPQHTFALNGFSGRVYINFGPKPLPAAPTPGAPGDSPYIVFEPTVFPAGASNMDLSYVDGVSCAASIAVCDGTTGAPLPALEQNPQVTAGDIMTKVASLVPAAAQITKGTEIVRIMSSAAAPAAYHDWTDLMTVLQGTTAKEPLHIRSFSSPPSGTIPTQ